MMIESLSLLSFIITCFVIELTPGVNMSYLAILSITNGRKAGYAATAGVAFGLIVIGIASALGVATLIEKSPYIYELLRVAGIFYLLWLAWDTWQTKILFSEKEVRGLIYHAKYFRRGFIQNVLNPKAVIFYISILPKFINPNISVSYQAVFLTLIFVSIATFIHVSIVTMASTTRRILENDKQRLLIRKIMAILLVFIAIWFAITTKQNI